MMTLYMVLSGIWKLFSGKSFDDGEEVEREGLANYFDALEYGTRID